MIIATTSCKDDQPSLVDVDNTISADNITSEAELAPGIIPNDIGIVEVLSAEDSWQAIHDYNLNVIPLHEGESYYANAAFEGIQLMSDYPDFFTEATNETKDQYLNVLLAREHINKTAVVLRFLEDAQFRKPEREIAQMARLVWQKIDLLPEPQKESYQNHNRQAINQIIALGWDRWGQEL